MAQSLFLSQQLPERNEPSHPSYATIIMLIVFGMRNVRLVMLATATLCLAVNRLSAADPSVEVFTQDNPGPSAGEGDVRLFFPQLPFRWSLTVSGGFDDNVNTAPLGDASPFTQTNLTLSKDLRTARTLLSMEGSAGAVHYFDRMGNSTDYTGGIRLNLQHNISVRLAFGASINAAYQTEPQFATDLGSVRRSGNYFSTTDTLSARYMWSPRFSTYTSYQLGMVKYEDALVSAVQDRTDHTFGESLRYALSPRSTLISEYKFELIDYDTAPRDSSTHFVLGGLEYQISPRSKASLVGGATFRKFKQGNGDLLIDPNGSASFDYLLGPSLSLGWTASYSVEEPNFTETLTQKTARFRTGVQVNCQPGKHLSATLSLNYYHDDSSGVLASGSPGVGQKLTEDGFEFVIGGKYAVTNRLFFDLRFAHTEVTAIAGYSRNVSTAGLTFNF